MTSWLWNCCRTTKKANWKCRCRFAPATIRWKRDSSWTTTAGTTLICVSSMACCRCSSMIAARQWPTAATLSHHLCSDALMTMTIRRWSWVRATRAVSSKDPPSTSPPWTKIFSKTALLLLWATSVSLHLHNFDWSPCIHRKKSRAANVELNWYPILVIKLLMIAIANWSLLSLSASEEGESNPCWFQPCKNKGVCMAIGDAFECVCTMRYVGDRCQHDLGSLCQLPEHACMNGGTCRENSSGNGTVCLCAANFSGDHFSCQAAISRLLLD